MGDALPERAGTGLGPGSQLPPLPPSRTGWHLVAKQRVRPVPQQPRLSLLQPAPQGSPDAHLPENKVKLPPARKAPVRGLEGASKLPFLGAANAVTGRLPPA